jgi:hypothetical protein
VGHLREMSPSLGSHSPRGPSPQEREREPRPSTRILRWEDQDFVERTHQEKTIEVNWPVLDGEGRCTRRAEISCEL